MEHLNQKHFRGSLVLSCHSLLLQKINSELHLYKLVPIILAFERSVIVRFTDTPQR